jgi:hypothetical protein
MNIRQIHLTLNSFLRRTSVYLKTKPYPSELMQRKQSAESRNETPSPVPAYMQFLTWKIATFPRFSRISRVSEELEKHPPVVDSRVKKGDVHERNKRRILRPMNVVHFAHSRNTTQPLLPLLNISLDCSQFATDSPYYWMPQFHSKREKKKSSSKTPTVAPSFHICTENIHSSRWNWTLQTPPSTPNAYKTLGYHGNSADSNHRSG